MNLMYVQKRHLHTMGFPSYKESTDGAEKNRFHNYSAEEATDV